ncbi:MAG TPA: hypothetical protein VFV50_07040 [Bdellovibrionales bacterium]|nr:hypothetical protein [Bdellovibrionales bacterium]
MNRRIFLKNAGALALADAALTLLPSQLLAHELLARRAARAGLSIMQGLTTETTTQLTVDVPKAMRVAYTLTDRATGRVLNPAATRSVTNGSSPVRVDKIAFGGLELGHQYQLSVIDTASNKSLDERYLSPVDLSRSDARVAVMSCMKDSESAHKTMWPSAQSANADYYFFVGDAVYGDTLFSHGPDKLWSRFVETRSTLGIYQWKTLKPVLAVWDDHDYGKNNEDGSYKHKAGTLAVFKAFFAQDKQEPVLYTGPGNSMCLRAFNQSYLFLDSRYFRKLSSNGMTGFLGAEQIKWATSLVKNTKGPVWVMEGSPFFGRADKSSTSYQATAPKELDVFLKEVAGWNTPAVFMGGDVHYSEISALDKKHLGYSSFEFVSSSMHSSTKSKYYQNPNKQLQGSLKENFLMFDQTGAAGRPEWKVTCVGASNKTLFSGVYGVG